MTVLVRRSALTQKLHLSTGAHTAFGLAPHRAALVEMEDLHFHHSSAVLLPDAPHGLSLPARRPTAIAVIAACLSEAKKRPEHRMLVVGHADTSGPEANNRALSLERADAVLHLLTGQREPWAELAHGRNEPSDIQHVLHWVARTWGWPCAPTAPDDAAATEAAVRRFQTHAGHELARSIEVDGLVGLQTWGAIFDVYERALRDLLGADEDGLNDLRDGLAHTAQTSVGCGESFPVAAMKRDAYRSAENRRVEIFLFGPGEEPRLDCHPRADVCVKTKCDLHNARAYRIAHLPAPPRRLDPVMLRLRMTDVAGLYKPGYDDRDEERAFDDTEIERRSGYLPGYTSQDDLGRIFVNGVPRVDTSTTWQSVREKDTQYIELTVQVTASEGRVPGGLRIDWGWEDPDDPSDEGMHSEAGRHIDANDGFVPLGDDNVGTRDWPKKDAGTGAVFEQMAGYGMLPGADASTCHTAVVDGVSKIRLHCTNAGGDNFRVSAFLRAAPQADSAMGASTGTMTMWKRIDLEYRQMAGASHLPVDEAAVAFERAFVQLDVHWLANAPTKPYMTRKKKGMDRDVGAYLRKSSVFENRGKAGWFVLISALLPTGEVKANGEVKPIYTGTGRFVRAGDGASVVVDYVVPPRVGVAGINVHEGNDKVTVYAAEKYSVDCQGRTTITLYANDRHPRLEVPTGIQTGSLTQAYATGRYSYPRHSLHQPGGVVEDGGLGFGETERVSVYPKSAGGSLGISPTENRGGERFFAGRTVVFSKHRKFTDVDLPFLPDQEKLLHTIMHELGHAFGYAHKCGHYTADLALTSSCVMNYGSTWLYEPGGFVTKRFNTGRRSNDGFCAHHLAGIRQVHLEDNPALWKKW